MSKRRRGAFGKGAAWPVEAALVALLLQLLLPLANAQGARLPGGAEAPILICTGTGLVWAYPGDRPAGGEGEPEARCPACLSHAPVGAALLPSEPALPAPFASLATATGRAMPAPPARLASPPLPPRGPPLSA